MNLCARFEEPGLLRRKKTDVSRHFFASVRPERGPEVTFQGRHISRPTTASDGLHLHGLQGSRELAWYCSGHM